MAERDNSSKGFLERWSRKKIDAEREAPDAPAPSSAKAESLPGETGLPERPAENEAAAPAKAAPKPAFDLASLPSLDSITAATNIRAFLTPGVPKELARAALRRAWSADPAIRDFKGLAENDWDFTDPTAMPGFGALPPGYDIKKLVAQIFGGSEKPNEPGTAADKPAGRQSLDIAEEIAPPAPSAEAAPSTEGHEDSSTPEISADSNQVASVDIVQRDNNIAPHNSIADDESEEPKNRRPHGGALPQ